MTTENVKISDFGEKKIPWFKSLSVRLLKFLFYVLTLHLIWFILCIDGRLYKLLLVIDKKIVLESQITSAHFLTNLSTNPIDDVNFNHIEFIINPEQLSVCSDVCMQTFTIPSTPTDSEKRMSLRNIFAESECTKYVFLLGLSNNTTVTAAVKDESILYHDIVQGNFLDTHNNSVYKHAMGLQWATEYCPRCQLIIKTEDASVIDVDLLEQSMDYYAYTIREQMCEQMLFINSISCTVVKNVTVRRTGEFGVTKEEFPDDVYPDYCNGSFITYSGKAARDILAEAKKVNFFRVDEIFFTGILRQRLGLNITE